jgi:hypothetical protein
MVIEIVPAGATAVVTEDRHDKHPDRWDLSAQIQRNFDQTVKNQSDLGSAAALATNVAQKQISDFYAETLIDSSKNAAALGVQSQQETNQLSDQATNNANLGSVQAVNNFNMSSVSSQVQFNALTVQAVKNSYDLQLQAQMLASAAAAKAAECCCEIKTAIIFDGQKTRDLLNSITEQNLRDRAARSEAALAAYFAAKVAPTTPLS